MKLAKSSIRPALVRPLLAAALASLHVLPANAQQIVTGGWYNAGNVVRMHPGDAGTLFYFSTATQYGIANCQNTFGYSVDATNASASRQYATLLTAYTLGKPVWIHLTGTCTGANGRPLVDTIEITELNYQ